MTTETTKDKAIRHAKSAALTFASAVGLEVYAGLQNAANWGDVAWGALLSAATFTAARAAMKVLVGK